MLLTHNFSRVLLEEVLSYTVELLDLVSRGGFPESLQCEIVIYHKHAIVHKHQSSDTGTKTTIWVM